MSKRKSQGSILPPLQRRIILCLAQKGLQTINEITRNIPMLKLARTSHYKPTWQAVGWLKEKGLIREAGMKEYRGRRYPQFWLTDDGALLALTEGVPLERLLEETREIYPENYKLMCGLEVASKLNPDLIRVGHTALARKGKLEPIDLTTMVFTQMQTQTHDRTYEEIMEILKTYPEEYNSFKKSMEKTLEILNKLVNSDV